MPKATGAEIKEFYQEGWPKGYYHDDCELEVEDDADGKGGLTDDEKYEVNDFGVLVPEGDNNGEVLSFASVFRKWKKNRDTETLVIRVPKDRKEEIVALLRQAGCTL